MCSKIAFIFITIVLNQHVNIKFNFRKDTYVYYIILNYKSWYRSHIYYFIYINIHLKKIHIPVMKDFVLNILEVVIFYQF